jgi:hypothetical protein
MRKKNSAKSIATAIEQPTDLLDEKQAAAFLHITPRVARLWRTTRGLPHFKPTKKTTLYRRSDLLAWLEQTRVATTGGLRHA